MLTPTLAALAVVGLVVQLVLALCHRRLLRGCAALSPGPLPPVSILKPLKGLDPALAANLRTFFALEGAEYEVLFAVDDPDDPALAVARRVAAAHPRTPVAFVVAPYRPGGNPKVSNLAAMLPLARHPLLLISDSNVAAPPDLLPRMVAELERPGVGLVTCPIRGLGAEGPWAAVEALQLNTFAMGGVAAAEAAARVCAVGKSMLLRRSDLERIGGFGVLGRYLAEDQVCGERIAALGLALRLARVPVDNRLGRLTLRQVARRHLRWARIRRRMAPLAYAGELLANPVVPALSAFATAPGLPTAAAALAVTLTAAAIAAAAERRLGLRRPLLATLALEPLRQLLVTALWPVPFFSSTVEWRGRRYRLGPLTRLEPVTGQPEQTSAADAWGVEELEPQEAAV